MPVAIFSNKMTRKAFMTDKYFQRMDELNNCKNKCLFLANPKLIVSNDLKKVTNNG